MSHQRWRRPLSQLIRKWSVCPTSYIPVIQRGSSVAVWITRFAYQGPCSLSWVKLQNPAYLQLFGFAKNSSNMSHLRISATLALLCSVISPCFHAHAETPDYGQIRTWLCHPDNPKDACDRDLSTTIIAADGSLSREPSQINYDQHIECYYAYPTTSQD